MSETVAPRPSWRTPILWGLVATVLLHLPVVLQHLLWVLVFGALGATGLPLGVLPVWLATRRERLTPMSGFALAFYAVGLGMVTLVVMTLVVGFRVSSASEASWRDEFAAQDVDPAEIDSFFAMLHGDRGPSIAVLAATFVVFGAGLSGAVTAALRGRRRDAAARAAAPKSAAAATDESDRSNP